MTPTERRRLVGVLGLLASDQDGERAAAGLLATRLLRTAGLTWEEVIPERVRQVGEPIASPSRPHSPLIAWHTDLALAVRNIRFLRDWERNFVSGLSGFAAPSKKQRMILAGIADNLRTRGRT